MNRCVTAPGITGRREIGKHFVIQASKKSEKHTDGQEFHKNFNGISDAVTP
jgi:hypothetical protein